MRPGWEDAPEWAKWLAMDESGAWFWYENQPYSDCDGEWFANGMIRPALAHLRDWMYSLEERPK